MDYKLPTFFIHLVISNYIISIHRESYILIFYIILLGVMDSLLLGTSTATLKKALIESQVKCSIYYLFYLDYYFLIKAFAQLFFFFNMSHIIYYKLNSHFIVIYFTLIIFTTFNSILPLTNSLERVLLVGD